MNTDLHILISHNQKNQESFNIRVMMCDKIQKLGRFRFSFISFKFFLYTGNKHGTNFTHNKSPCNKATYIHLESEM